MSTDTYSGTSSPTAPMDRDSSQQADSSASHAESDIAAPEIVILQSTPPRPHGAVQDDAADDAGQTAAIDDNPSTAPPLNPIDPLPRPKETRIIAMINQKGGVGKTTSTVNLGAGLACLGYRVLMIDLDPQAHMTLHLGVDPTALERSNYDLLTDDDISASEVVQRISDNLFLLPAEVNLAGAETEMAPKLVTGRAQRVLKEKVTVLMQSGIASNNGESNNDKNGASNNNDNGGASTQANIDKSIAGRFFDYVLIDCPPSLGLLTINALSFAKEVFVPMQAHFLALQGLSKLLETVGHIRGGFNADLRVTGIVLCMHEKQTLLAGEVTADLKAFLDGSRDQDVPWRDAIVLTPSIRRNIKLAESPSFGTTIFQYAPDSNGAQDYRQLALSVVKQGETARK